MTQWTQQAGSAAPQRYDFGYDTADQVVAATLKDPSSGTILKQYYYGYDTAGNRLNEQIDSNINQFTYNNVNQISSNPAGGSVRFQGSISEPGTVSVNGSPATMATSTSFVANPVLANGTNTVTVSATDGSGNTQNNVYQVTVSAAGGSSPTYDADGNMTSNNGQTYTWDARNHLIKIAYADSSTTEFTYDGLGRRVQIVEKNSSATVTSTKNFIWCGMEMCEERDAANDVETQYFSQGEKAVGALTDHAQGKYYYTRDHLGSVREVVYEGGDTSRYRYDPWGRRSRVLTDPPSSTTIGYTGHYYHEKSGLTLAPYRAYDANLGRWLSRDPIEEEGGINLYGYCQNDSVNYVDPDGKLLGAAGLGLAIGTVLVTGYAFYANYKAANEPGTYASTISGTPITMHSDCYNNLSGAGKRIIDRHEAVHQHQSFLNWKGKSEAEREIPAYQEQIRAADEELNRPGNSSNDIQDAKSLKNEAEANIAQYELQSGLP